MKKLCVCMMLLAGTAAAELWRTDVTTGYFNDPNNWTGGVIAVNGAKGYIRGANIDYTIQFPSEGYEENGYTGLDNFGATTAGNWLTFDVSNSWWRKGPAIYPSDWEAFLLKQGGNGHIFNVESVSKVAPARPVFFWSNAVFRFYASSSVVSNIFESGYFNLYTPGTNGEKSDNNLITGSSGSPTRQWTIFRAGSKTILNGFTLRAANSIGSTIYEGGEHEIRGGLAVKATYGGWVTGRLEVAGNTLLKTYGTITVGAAVNGNGLMTIKDSATLTMNGNQLYVGSTTLSTGTVTVTGSGKLLGLSGTSDIYVGNGTTNQATLNLKENGTVGILSSVGTVYIASNNEQSRGYLNMDGGVFAATNSVLETRGDLSEVNLNGGTSYFKEIRMTGRTPAAQTTLTVRGGEHTIGSSGFNIGNSTNRSALAIVAAGKLFCTNAELRVGYGTGTEGMNIFRQTGGEVILNYRSCYAAAVPGSRGRVELFGGTLTANRLGGGAGALASGSTGRAELFADGGTFAFYPGTSTTPIEKLDAAVLGAAGLTYNAGDYDTTINQAFSDADSVAGRFIKNGNGKLTLQQNSAHAITVINGGSLAFSTSAAQFGKNLTLNTVTLEMDLTDSLQADTLSATNVLLTLSDVLTTGTYTLFKSVADIASFTNTLTLLAPSPFRSYTWSVVPVEGFNELRLTIALLPDPVTHTWTGAQDMTWGTAANWSSSSVPAIQDYATFAGANPGAINIPSGSAITRLIFNSAAAYTLEGNPLTIVDRIESVTGSHEIAAPIKMVDGVRLTLQADSPLRLSGALSGIQADVVKTSTGRVTLAGANTFSGSIVQQGGILALEGAAAWGTAKPATNGLIVKAGTVQHGGSAAAVARGVTFDSGSDLAATLLNTVTDLTLTGAFNTLTGPWIKRGAGILALEPASGSTHKLTASNGRASSNNAPTGDLAFPADGSTPSTGFGGLTVAEGTLRLKGTSSTTFNMLHSVVVGARTVGSETANAALEIDGCRVNQGGSGIHLVVGNEIAAGHSNTNPVLRLINGAYLDINGGAFGNGGSQKYVPELVMDGAGTVFSCFFSYNFGSGNIYVYPRVRLSNGARLQSRGQWESWGGAGGIFFKSPVDFIADSGAILDQYQVTGETIFSNYGAGQLLFRNGAIMRHGRLFFRNYGAPGAVELVFDNGILEPQGVNTSFVCRALQQGIRILDGGLTLNTASNAFYRCGLPIRGTGTLVKTGPGTAVFGQAIELISDTATNWFTGIPTLQQTGRTEIQQGTVILGNGGITATGAVTIASDARLDLSGLTTTLGTVAGSGTIAHGSLTATYDFEEGALLNLEDIAEATLTVNFGRAPEQPMPAGKKAVATLSGSVKPTVTGWKTVHAGENYSATYSVETNTVFADIRYIGSTRIILR